MRLLANSFTKVVAGVMVLTAIAKLHALTGASTFFAEQDPVVGISFAWLVAVAAILEIAVATICIFRPLVDRLVAITWLASIFLAYRISLWWIGWQEPCGCLGNLTDALGMSSQLVDNFMKGVLAFMLIGSVSLLMLHWRNKVAARPGKISNTPAAMN